MSIQQKKFNTKIPYYVKVVYNESKKILTVIGPLATKSMKLELKIKIDSNKKIISVSPLPFFQASNAKKKRLTHYDHQL